MFTRKKRLSYPVGFGIDRHAENDHLRSAYLSNSVIDELESCFVEKSAGAVGAASRVLFPTVGDLGESVFIREAVHHSQLHDVQAMVEIAGDHGEPRAGLLVERPESEVVVSEIVQKRADSA